MPPGKSLLGHCYAPPKLLSKTINTIMIRDHQ